MDQQKHSIGSRTSVCLDICLALSFLGLSAFTVINAEALGLIRTARVSLQRENISTIDQIRLARAASQVISTDAERSSGTRQDKPKPTVTPTERDRPIAERCQFSGQLELDKLAKAVARFETGSCSLGSGSVNNCFGIRGDGWFKKYDTPEESFKDFKRIWTSYYQGLPTIRKARKWTGNDRADHWLCGVHQFYYQSL